MAKLDTTKYNAQVANAASQVKISSTIFKAFIADLKTVIDGNDDLRVALAAALTAHEADFAKLQNARNGINSNAIINGGFNVAQRGTSFSGLPNGSYGLDRWRVAIDGAGATYTISQQAFTLGQPDVPGEPRNFLRYDTTVAGSGQATNAIQQPIESVRTFAGQDATLSFYAKADTARTLTVAFFQLFGTGGSPSSAAGTAAQNASLTTSWQKFSLTFAIPSISGKTIGTNNDDTLLLSLIMPLNSTFTIDIAQVQLCVGDTDQPFQPRSYDVEERDAMRYNIRLSNSSVAFVIFGTGRVTSATAADIFVPLPSRMRSAITLITGGSFNLNGLLVTGISLDANTARRDGVLLKITVGGGGLTTGEGATLVASNDTTAFLNFDSEL